MRRNSRIYWTLAALIVSGCAVERTGRLYPANDTARPGGVLEATFEAHGTGHGAAVIDMPDGEVLTGEFSIVRGGGVSFGSIFGEVYGSSFMPGGSPGMASAFGNKGTSMSCEFYNDNFSGHGMGACRSSTGALYRLQY